MRRKVTVVGAGNVGATCAQELARRDYADVVVVDIKEGLPQGKALDLNQAGAVLGYEPNVTGSNGYEESAGSAVVVISQDLDELLGLCDTIAVINEGRLSKAMAVKDADIEEIGLLMGGIHGEGVSHAA